MHATHKYSADLVPLTGDDGPRIVGVAGITMVDNVVDFEAPHPDRADDAWTDHENGATTFLYGHEVWYMGDGVTEAVFTMFYAYHPHDEAGAAPSMCVRMFP